MSCFLAAKIDRAPLIVKRELLYCWVLAATFSVLVPKRRGYGYVKVPFGHHENAELGQIAHKCGCDIFGLDGTLDFQVGRAIFYGPENGRIVFEESVMPMLEAYYGMPSRRIDGYEFWLLNPQRKLDT